MENVIKDSLRQKGQTPEAIQVAEGEDDQKIDELLRERTQAATRHNEELQLLNQKHREKQGAVELSHQKEISELIAKYENIIMEKQKCKINKKTFLIQPWKI